MAHHVDPERRTEAEDRTGAHPVPSDPSAGEESRSQAGDKTPPFVEEDHQSPRIEEGGGESTPEGTPPTTVSYAGAGSKAGAAVGRFGDYELLNEIARGGMGVVYRARQVKLNRIVALKRILDRQLASEEQIRRFYLEAEAAANLDHPGIVPIYEVGEHEGQHFYSMGFVEGKSLSEALRDGTLPPGEAAELLVKIAAAVVYAHQRGVIHRDLKPANILLDGEQQPRVADFGLAKRIESDSGLTATGQVLGTPSYMAPEQAAGKSGDVGPLVDVYALGAILYRLLTGHAPFRGATVLETLEQVRSLEPVPPRRLRPSVPRDLETICLKCLQKEPGKRYTSGQALLEDLRRYVAGEPIVARPTPWWERCWKWTRRRPLVAALTAAVAAAVAGLLVLAFSYSADLRRYNWELQQESLKAQQEERKAKGFAAQSSHRLRRVLINSGNQHLREGDLSGALVWYAEALRELEQQLDRREPAASTDATTDRTRIAALLDQCPRLVHVLRQREGQVRRAEFTPDGRHILTVGVDFSAKRGLINLWDRTTGSRVYGPVEYDYLLNDFRFNADGSRFVTTGLYWGGASNHRIEQTEVRVWETRSGKPLSGPLKWNEWMEQAVFHPDGQHLITFRFGEYAAARAPRLWEIQTGQQLGLLRNQDGPVPNAMFSPDGALVATVAGKGDKTQVHIWDSRTGRPVGQPMPQNHTIREVLFSANGRRIVMVGGSLQTWNVATSQPISPLFARGITVRDARLTPSGGAAMVVAADNSIRLFDTRRAHALGGPIIHEKPVFGYEFSPDGLMLATFDSGGVIRTWDTRTANSVGPQLRHPEGAEARIAFSPDARQMLSVNGPLVRVWDMGVGSRCSAPVRHGLQIHGTTGLRGQNDEGYVAVLADRNTVRVIDPATNASVGRLLPYNETVSYAELLPVAKRVLTVAGKTVEIRDVQTGEPLIGPLTFKERTSIAAISPSGGRVAIGRKQGARVTVQAWDTTTGSPVGPELNYDFDVRCGFSPDGRLLVACFAGMPGGAELTRGADSARVWDVESGKQISRLSHGREVVHAVFSHDGTRVVTASTGKSARIWEVATGRPVTAPLKHAGDVLFAAFSPDDKRIVTAGHAASFPAGEARVWDAATGEPLTPPMTHAQAVLHAAFLPQGRLLATASGIPTERQGAVQLWDAVTGDPVSAPLRRPVDCRGASFDSAHSRLRMTFADVIQTCGLAVDHRRVADLVKLAELMSGRRIDVTSGLVPIDPDDLVELLSELRSLYPEELTSTKDENLSWRLRRAARGENTSNWFALRFHLDPLIKAGPGDASLYVRRGKAHAGLADWQSAFADYSQALRHGVDNLAVRRGRARAYQQLERWAPAVDDYTLAICGGGDDHAARAFCFAKLRRWQPAVADYSQAIELNPRQFPARYNRGVAYEWLGQWRLAREDYAKVVELKPDHGLAWGALAAVHARNGSLDEAAQCYAKALRFGTTEWQKYYQYALVALARGDVAGHRAAMSGLVRFTKQSRHHESLREWLWLAVLSPRAGESDRQEWIVHIQQALEKSPQDAKLLTSLGAAQYRAGHYNDAVSTLGKVSKLPLDEAAESCLFLAMSHQRLGQPTKAAKWLDKATEWLSTRVGKTSPAASGMAWTRRLELQVLHAEAKRLLATVTTER